MKFETSTSWLPFYQTKVQNSVVFFILLGLPAETVANTAVEELIESLENNCCVDQHLQDQVITM